MMTTELILPFSVQPDLTATMDIQIPALAWQPSGTGTWSRTYRIDGTAIEVTVTEDQHALRFQAPHPLTPSTHMQLAALVRDQFPRQVSALSLDTHPVLATMGRHYQGVVIMHTDPFEALVLTVLSQNRTGEIVRKVYPLLEARCGGMTPGLLTALDDRELAEVIRSAGPYKATRLAAAARKITADGQDLFNKTITEAPGAQALMYLTSLPGVAHKTAACVLVFAGRSSYTLPVDTHLFRVTRRLGLTSHDGTLTATTRDAVVSAMLHYGADLAPAHFLFLLVGRATCAAGIPRCDDCFLQQHCPSAPGGSPAPAGAGAGQPAW
jgi:endonuclease III